VPEREWPLYVVFCERRPLYMGVFL
jgi:hypothetical protein